MKIIKKLNNLNIILVALASITTIITFLIYIDFSFKDIIFYISKFAITSKDIVDFIFGVDEKLENFIKENYKKIIFLVLTLFFISGYFTLILQIKFLTMNIKIIS